MAGALHLKHRASRVLRPRAPYHVAANLRKPSHYPSSDNASQGRRHWITMRWRGKRLGLRFEDLGSTDAPRLRLTVFSAAALSDGFLRSLLPEVAWRFNFNQDIADFTDRYRNDAYLGPAIEQWRGMKPVAANSLYETLMIYVTLQNAVIRRSIQMLEALFDRFGRDVRFDGRTMSTFWTPQEMLSADEPELRALKVGYRARMFLRISEAFGAGRIDEESLRTRGRDEIVREVGELYGIGPASLEYLLFEDFYCLDALRIVPPWERKIMSRVLFAERLAPEARILAFFRRRYPGYEKLAFHYLWEDLFWRHSREPIDWLAKEIRR